MSSASISSKASKGAQAKKAAPRTKYASAEREGLILAKEGQIYRPRPRPQPASDASSFKKSYKKVEPELQGLIDMVLDPDAVEQGARWPNHYGLSSTYRSTNIVNAAFDANKQSMVIVHPRLANSIFSTAGTAYTQALTVTGTAAGNFIFQDIALDESHPDVKISAPWYFNSQRVALPQPTNVPAGITNQLYPISWNSTDATPIATFNLTNIGSGNVGQLQMRMRWFDATYTQIAVAQQVIQANGVCVFNLNATATTNITGFISFEVLGAVHPYIGRLIGELREVGGGPFMSVTLPNVYHHCVVSELNGARTIINSAETYTVLAQSLLVTHVGSTLADGGVIATARVPGSTVVGDKAEAGSDSAAGGNNYYNWISSLPANRYDGKVKMGCYSFYLGDDEESYFYRNVEEEYDQRPYLIAAFSTTDTASSVCRIKIVTHVAFKSNSTIYSQAASPYMRDAKMLPHVLSLINSSYCNDEHKAGLKEQLKSIGRQVGKVLVSPTTWTTVAEIMAMLAL